MVIGMLIILLQPFRSSNVNKYHALLPFIIAIVCFGFTLSDQVESKTRWMTKSVSLLAGIFYVSPIMAVIVYIAYKCYRRCHTLCLKTNRRNPEMESLMIGNRSRESYQAINYLDYSLKFGPPRKFV